MRFDSRRISISCRDFRWINELSPLNKHGVVSFRVAGYSLKRSNRRNLPWTTIRNWVGHPSDGPRNAWRWWLTKALMMSRSFLDWVPAPPVPVVRPRRRLTSNFCGC